MRILIILLTLAAFPVAARAGCFDVSKSEPAELSGVLSHRIFAGPPGYEDVDKGDTPEPGYVLKLAAPICLTGDPDFTDPSDMFDEVQLVSREATATAMQALDGRPVTVRLSGHIPAHTGHHHRPLVAWVDDIVPGKARMQETATAATTVRAFYLALADGDGETASALVVAGKRSQGPFSAKALSRFYGALRQPLQLVDVDEGEDGRIIVRYRYATGSRRCEGTATVRTTRRDDRYYIAGIKTDSGC